MKVFKKAWVLVLCLCVALCSMSVVVSADQASLKIGDYVIVGKHGGKPIVWRYVVDDENGKLFISDRVICKKTYGEYDSWAESSIRMWLNSDEPLGIYSPENTRFQEFDGENGFLSAENFSQAEINLFQPTTQWTMVAKASLVENGVHKWYNIVKEYGEYSHFSSTPTIYFRIDEIPDIYHGPAHQTTDRIFLPDEMQVYQMLKNVGTVMTTLPDDGNYYGYMLRSALGGGRYTIIWEEENLSTDTWRWRGIRPAFYLNESAIETMTGSGTAEDPYVLNQRTESNNMVTEQKITVLFNGQLLSFENEPIIRYDRVLVPYQTIFDAFGAQASYRSHRDWSGQHQDVNANKDGTQIKLEMNINKMYVNGEEVLLDTFPHNFHNNILVPVRAVSEALGAKVDWNNDLRQVIITTE